MTYHGFLALGLFLAAICNLYSTRALALVFISAMILLVLPSVFPDPNTLQAAWFPFLMLIELCFAGMAVAARIKASSWVAGLSLLNVVVDAFGLSWFEAGSPLIALYSGLIRRSECAQVIALILYSQPALNLGAIMWLSIKGRNDEHMV